MAAPPDLLAGVKKGKVPPVLILTGRDLYSRDALLAGLRGALVAEGFSAFNYAALSGEEVSGIELAERAALMPMGPGRRLLLVRRAEKIREKEIKPLAAYAAAPSESTCLVFVFDESKGAAFTALRKAAPVLDCPAPRDYQMARWLQGQAKRLGLELEPAAARELAARAGDDHIAGMTQLQKAALAPGRAGSAARVTLQAVQAMESAGRDANPFHLSDAVLGGEPARAVRILRDLLEGGTTGYAILGALESQLRRFLKMRGAMARGEPARRVIQSASPTLPDEVKARLAGQLTAFDEARLIEAFRLARRADRAIKSHGSATPEEHLAGLIWRMATPS